MTSSDPGPTPPVPAVAGNDAPIAHDDGPYFATHGKSIPGSYPSVLFNDVGIQLSVVSGGLPSTVSNTPGGSAVAYQVTDVFGGSSGASATVISTNQNPSDSPGMLGYAVIRPDLATIAPPSFPMPGLGSPLPTLLGGMTPYSMSDTANGTIGFDLDGDPTTAVVATAPAFGTMTLTPYITAPSGGATAWAWNYNASPGFFNVVDSFSFTVTDNVGGSTTTRSMQIAITNKPKWNWLTIDAKDDLTSWGSSWDTAGTGNVMGNDYNPDGLAMTTTWGAAPTGFTGNADGSYSYLPPNIAAFMTGPDVVIPYSVIDANSSSGGASLIIKPKILRPREGASLNYS